MVATEVPTLAGEQRRRNVVFAALLAGLLFVGLTLSDERNLLAAVGPVPSAFAAIVVPDRTAPPPTASSATDGYVVPLRRIAEVAERRPTRLASAAGERQAPQAKDIDVTVADPAPAGPTDQQFVDGSLPPGLASAAADPLPAPGVPGVPNIFSPGSVGSPGDDTDGNSTDNGSVSAVPEPAAWLTMILGFAVMGEALRRARRTMPATSPR